VTLGDKFCHSERSEESLETRFSPQTNTNIMF